jgi:hypothetical protein
MTREGEKDGRKEGMHILRQRDRARDRQDVHPQGRYHIQFLLDEMPKEPPDTRAHPEAGQVDQELQAVTGKPLFPGPLSLFIMIPINAHQFKEGSSWQKKGRS